MQEPGTTNPAERTELSQPAARALRLLVNVTMLAILVVAARSATDLILTSPPGEQAMAGIREWFAARHDPPLRTSIDLASLPGFRSVGPSSSRGTVVCLVSSCTACTFSTVLLELRKFKKKHADIRCTIVSPDSFALEELRATSRFSQLEYAHDPQKSTARRLNAFFLPRVYLFHSDGRLAYVQPPHREAARALRDVEQILVSSGR